MHNSLTMVKLARSITGKNKKKFLLPDIYRALFGLGKFIAVNSPWSTPHSRFIAGRLIAATNRINRIIYMKFFDFGIFGVYAALNIVP